jgi:hypothetical protein
MAGGELGGESAIEEVLGIAGKRRDSRVIAPGGGDLYGWLVICRGSYREDFNIERR